MERLRDGEELADMMKTTDMTVAVIGAGPAGLAAIKSLQEEGFQVTGFERRDQPGGLWTFSDDPNITSVTTNTKAQLSKFLTPFSDFPHADDFPRHGTAAELGKYYRDYADFFGLSQHVVFNVTVESIRRDDADSQWLVKLSSEREPRCFDKVVYAIGSEVIAKWPALENISNFAGDFIHGQSYKRPSDYENKTVVVIGQGNSAADCAVEVASFASKVFFAHRRGAVIVPRMVNGQRFDKFASWKATRIGYWIGRVLPSVNLWLLQKVFVSAREKTWGQIEPHYRFDTKPGYFGNVSATLINDELIPALRDGRVVSTYGVRRVLGPRSVEMDDGTILDDVDTIIACTGYWTPFSTIESSPSFFKPHYDVPEQPNLYQNIFDLNYPDSLACLNFIVAPENAASCRELAAIAIAQVWADKSTLPTREDMRQQIEQRHLWFAQRCLEQPVPQLEGLIDPDIWLPFVHKTAGTGLYENLGWTWAGCRFALQNPSMYLTLAYGIHSPHNVRYFDTGKRKAWPQAKETILRVNRLSAIDLKESKAKNE